MRSVSSVVQSLLLLFFYPLATIHYPLLLSLDSRSKDLWNDEVGNRWPFTTGMKKVGPCLSKLFLVTIYYPLLFWLPSVRSVSSVSSVSSVVKSLSLLLLLLFFYPLATIHYPLLLSLDSRSKDLWNDEVGSRWPFTAGMKKVGACLFSAFSCRYLLSPALLASLCALCVLCGAKSFDFAFAFSIY